MPAADSLSNVILERLNREVGRGDGVVACSLARFLLASGAAVWLTRKSVRRFFSVSIDMVPLSRRKPVTA